MDFGLPDFVKLVQLLDDISEVVPFFALRSLVEHHGHLTKAESRLLVAGFGHFVDFVDSLLDTFGFGHESAEHAELSEGDE